MSAFGGKADIEAELLTRDEARRIAANIASCRSCCGRKKAALAALVFEDQNGPTSSQRTVPQGLKHIEAWETP